MWKTPRYKVGQKVFWFGKILDSVNKTCESCKAVHGERDTRWAIVEVAVDSRTMTEFAGGALLETYSIDCYIPPDVPDANRAWWIPNKLHARYCDLFRTLKDARAYMNSRPPAWFGPEAVQVFEYPYRENPGDSE